MIIKNEIPLLEFDTDTHAVIEPTHERLDVRLPRRCVFAFLGAYIDEYAKAVKARRVCEFISATKHYPVYLTEYKGETVVLCQAPVGAAPAAQLLDFLIGYGVRDIISTGSCGCLDDFSEGAFLVPYKALRDEGASYHYAPPSRFMEINEHARKAIKEALLTNGVTYKDVVTWSTDGFFRETKEKVVYRRSEGCSAVDMECAALAAVAAFRGATWGMLFYTADTLSHVDTYDERAWGADAYKYALTLSLDAVLNL